jgi:hypothetical protein
MLFHLPTLEVNVARSTNFALAFGARIRGMAGR